MKNLALIQCGLLALVSLVGSATPQVSLEPLPINHNEEREGTPMTDVHPRPKLLQGKPVSLLSLKLNTWGSKSTSPSTWAMSPPTYVVDLQLTKNEIASATMMSLLTSTLQSYASANTDLFMVFGITLLVLCFVGCLLQYSESEDKVPEEDVAPTNAYPEVPSISTTPVGSQVLEPEARNCSCGHVLMLDSQFCRHCGKRRGEEQDQETAHAIATFTAIRTAESLTVPPTDTATGTIDEVEYSHGSWARAYRDAKDLRREALELLFRCNIISTQEFAYSRVSQEHIDECVWIGTYMLKQKPLEEWVALWQQAQQTFEDSVTACFTARTESRSNYGPIGGSAPPRSEVPLLDCHIATSHAMEDMDPDDPYTTRSSINMSQWMSPQSDYKSNLQAVPDTQPGIPPSFDGGMPSPPPGTTPQRMLSPLIMRCREIMEAPPQEGVPPQGIPTQVNRSSSVASTVLAGQTKVPQDSASESSLTPNVSPTPASLSPSMPSVSLPPTPPGPMKLPPTAVPTIQQQTLMALAQPPQDGGGALRSRPLAARGPDAAAGGSPLAAPRDPTDGSKSMPVWLKPSPTSSFREGTAPNPVFASAPVFTSSSQSAIAKAQPQKTISLNAITTASSGMQKKPEQLLKPSPQLMSRPEVVLGARTPDASTGPLMRTREDYMGGLSNTRALDAAYPQGDLSASLPLQRPSQSPIVDK